LDATLKAKTVFMHLHSYGIFHRYLHLSNVMFDDNWDVRVTGFAFARREGHPEWFVLGGRPAYIPPELHNPVNPTSSALQQKADVWAFGTNM
jgi:serine/threonine protein kinase